MFKSTERPISLWLRCWLWTTSVGEDLCCVSVFIISYHLSIAWNQERAKKKNTLKLVWLISLLFIVFSLFALFFTHIFVNYFSPLSSGLKLMSEWNLQVVTIYYYYYLYSVYNKCMYLLWSACEWWQTNDMRKWSLCLFIASAIWDLSVLGGLFHILFPLPMFIFNGLCIFKDCTY